ncbi:MAG: RNA polymerase sigma factor [Candidatus Zhuqueibacterota bacterium]
MEAHHETDEQLIQDIRAGDDAAFKVLVQRYESRVAATVIGMLGRCPEAEDVGQETFIRFYDAIDSFRGDSSVATYLTRIAMNLSLNELKRRKRRALFFRRTADTDLNIPDAHDASDHVDKKEFVQHALQRLEPKFKAVLVLRLIDGYSTTETAHILKLPVGTVLSRLARGQQKLKEILTPIMEFNHG